MNCLVACVYNPSKLHDLEPAFSKISDETIKYENVILCGDFNFDLLVNGTRSTDLLLLQIFLFLEAEANTTIK